MKIRVKCPYNGESNFQLKCVVEEDSHGSVGTSFLKHTLKQGDISHIATHRKFQDFYQLHI